MAKYVLTACLFLAGNEALSLLTLTIIGVMFLFDLACCAEREGKR